MNILEAINDDQLFRPFLANENDSLDSWSHWMTALRVLYGLPVAESEHELIRTCTGRDPTKLPSQGFDTALLLIGRRSGKSRTAAIIAAYESVLSGRESRLSKGEQGIIPVISPTRRQSQVVRGYIRGVLDTPILANEITNETKEGFDLKNGVSVETLVADWRTVRNFTTLSVIIDEAAFLQYSEESRVKSDSELIRALKPSLATCAGRLIAISSPYAMRGWCYTTYKRHFGNDGGNTLVWNCGSRTMNPTLPQSVVDDALEEDPAGARAEYLGQFRDDVDNFVSREVVESLVVPGRKLLMPQNNLSYVAFADVSGGRHDDAALAIAHKEGRIIIIDCLKRYKSPHNPHVVVGAMVQVLKTYNCTRAIGDAYAAEWVRTTFAAYGIRYDRASTTAWKEGSQQKNRISKPRSQLYAELLPILHAGEIQLLDDDILVTQLSSLERRTRSGGRDIIDHPPNCHDDLANAVAGAANYATQRRMKAGAITSKESSNPIENTIKYLDRRTDEINKSRGFGCESDYQENFHKAMRELQRTDPFFQQFRR